MKRVFLFLALLSARDLTASPCWEKIFEWNEKTGGSGKKILLLPFENASTSGADDWIGLFFPILIRDYLSMSRSREPVLSLFAPRTVLFDPEGALEIARSMGADSLVIGQVSRKGATLQIHTRFLDVANRSEKNRVGGQVDFPGTRGLNDFVVDLVEALSQNFKGISLTKKKLRPVRNETTSAEALRFYVLGSTALEKGTPEGVGEALGFFEASIRSDYNYTPAYLGLALALVRQGLIEKFHNLNYRPSLSRARKQLETARLLGKALTKQKESVLHAYLEADTHSLMAGDYEKRGESKNAVRELRKALELLPGNIDSRERLIHHLETTGDSRAIRREAGTLRQLTECGGGE